MPQIIVGDGHRASRRHERHFAVNAGTFGGIEVVTARDDSRGPPLQRRILRIVEGQQISGTVRPALSAILVHVLALAVGLVVVGMTMGL